LVQFNSVPDTHTSQLSWMSPEIGNLLPELSMPMMLAKIDVSFTITVDANSVCAVVAHLQG
jgi:hypothetical protein